MEQWVKKGVINYWTNITKWGTKDFRGKGSENKQIELLNL